MAQEVQGLMHTIAHQSLHGVNIRRQLGHQYCQVRWSVFLIIIIVAARAMMEIEQVHQVAYGRPVQRKIGIATAIYDRIWQVVTTAGGQWGEPPIGLDKFENGYVVVVCMIDVAASRMRRNHDQWNARAI